MADNTIHVPSTIDGVHALMTVRKWEKAAIVWAYVRGSDTGGRPTPESLNSETSRKMTPDEFAALGLAGLRSAQTVRRYWKAWNDAIDSGHAAAVEPGETIVEPAIEWEPFTDATNPNRVGGEDMAERYATEAERLGTTQGSAIRAGSNPKAVAAAILADPKVAEVAEKALRDKRIQDEERRRELIVDGELSSMAAGGSGHVDTSDVEHGGAFDTGEALAAATRAEAEQRELIHQLQDHAEAYILAARKLHGYGIIGDPYAVGRVKETNRLLVDAVFGVNDLLVENNVIRPTTEGNQK